MREGGRFECMGCHDPHPSNENYRYLRVDVGDKGQKLDVFCAECHSGKADRSAKKASAPAAPAKPAPKA
jgi:predicted CXXCH cytochrome family protein